MIRLQPRIEITNFSIRAFRAQTDQFELFELILLLKLDKQFPVEQFEAAASQSAVPYPPLADPWGRERARPDREAWSSR